MMSAAELKSKKTILDWRHPQAEYSLRSALKMSPAMVDETSATLAHSVHLTQDPTGNQELVSNLPEEILPGPSLNQEQSNEYIQRVLIQNLPSTDSKNLAGDLKWKFLLDKHSFSKKKIANKKKSFLTRNQRKELNLLKLPKDGWSYASLKPLRDMWKDYMRQNLDLVSKAPNNTEPDWNSFSIVLAKSELVGAEMCVIKSKVPSQVGTRGTVILETKMTLQFVTPASKLKIILKESSVFQFQLDKIRFTVYGKYIATRPSERSVKKIKGLMIPDL